MERICGVDDSKGVTPEKERFENFDPATFAKKTFWMFGGKDQKVTLLCRRELAGVVLDCFGHDVFMVPVDAEHFRVHVTASVSPQFFWLGDWCGEWDADCGAGGGEREV